MEVFRAAFRLFPTFGVASVVPFGASLNPHTSWSVGWLLSVLGIFRPAVGGRITLSALGPTSPCFVIVRCVLCFCSSILAGWRGVLVWVVTKFWLKHLGNFLCDHGSCHPPIIFCRSCAFCFEVILITSVAVMYPVALVSCITLDAIFSFVR